MNRGFFITGTDTGVGKTVVAAALAIVLRESGRDVGVFKPVASGCVRRREGLVSEDAEFLAKAAEVPETLEEISPVRFEEPLAPTVAAVRAGVETDLEPVWQAWRRLRDAHEILLVEGIGGILCPVTRAMSVADLAKEFRLPLLVVARSTLGTINHTVLTIEAARARGLAVAGVVVNRYNHESPDLAEMTSPDEIQRVTGVRVLGLVPEDRATDFRAGVVGPDALAAVRQLPLKRLLA
jgi:dethiobiotin synthetase